MQDNPQSISADTGEQEQIRRQKLAKLTAEGTSPYLLTRFDITHESAGILSDFTALEGKNVAIAGRMISRRIMGKASFAHLLDGTGSIQVYVRKDDVGEDAYAAFRDNDVGDILGVSGFIFKTKTGEVSLHAQTVTLLSKCLKPLPEKYHGLTDTDLRYRQRYLDMIVNPEVRDVFVKRSRILSSVREFLDGRGFLEVDTPILHTLEIGAAARPFKTHHNTLDIDMFLRIETELFLKRLIVGGFDKVYEAGRIFRNEGMDTRHNPEFSTVECYMAYADYHMVMCLVEDLYAFTAQKVCGSKTVPWMGHTIDLTAPWPRMTMAAAVREHSGLDYYDWQDDSQARAACLERGVHTEPSATRGECLAALFDAFVEPRLIQPTFIMDYPLSISPLAKRKPDDPEMTERFEYFINGCEMGNAFSELNDPVDQKARFEKQVAAKKAQGIDASVDDDFINALEYGMPPTGGLGFGLDRLVMMLTNSDSIRDVLLFPTMKPRNQESK
jgi:lysyl-tRNA synthetase, class II